MAVQLTKKGEAKPKTAKEKARHQAKVGTVMGEFKGGSLKSSSGAKVKSKAQALAIALSEGRRAVAKMRGR